MHLSVSASLGGCMCVYSTAVSISSFFPRLHPCCVVKRLCKVKVNLLSYSNFKNIYGVAKSLNMKSIFVHLLAVISI